MSSIRTAELTPLALSILGMNSSEYPSSQPHIQADMAAPSQNAAQTIRPPRADAPRRTSHYNPFQTRCVPSTDGPPSYAVSERLARLSRHSKQHKDGDEALPQYHCTVLREGVMYMRIEKISPFQYLPKQQWRSVYVILRGTQLCIYKVKTSTFGSETLSGPGKLIRRYTLQHAEIGLASDVNDHILVPATRLAHLIPTMARRRAFEKDPDLFKCDKQYAMRLRLENDQLLLAQCKEESIFTWINSISAGMDVAYEIDERSVPRQCTVPRRQRQRRQGQTQVVENLQDRRLIAEQERILREMYPSLARSVEEAEPQDNSIHQIGTVDFAPTVDTNLALTATNINDQEAEDIDIAAMAEDVLQASISRPVNTRQTTASTVATASSFHHTNPGNLDESGKWAPVHPQSARQQFRYVRRCMPILLFDTPRSSSIIMCNGRRLHINQRMDMLEEWELAPPTYDAHRFPTTTSNELERVPTHTSVTETASIVHSASDAMEIQVVQTSNLEAAASGLEKTLSQKTQRSDSPEQLPVRPELHALGKVDEQSEHVENASLPILGWA